MDHNSIGSLERKGSRPNRSPLDADVITHIGALAVFLSTAIVYRITLSPTINSFDSAEFITGASTLGIVHAPGYPLYLLVAHLAARLPWGTVPFNVNLLSALCASASATVLYYACLRLSGAIWSSLLAVVLIALSGTFWSQAVVAEVYALNALLTSVIVLLAIGLYQKPRAKTLIGLAFVSGLSLTHHPSTILLFPSLLILVLGRRKQIGGNWRTWLASLFALGIPLILYLYLPLRFQANPQLNYVGDYFEVNLATLPGMLWMVSGQMFAKEIFGKSLTAGLTETGNIISVIWLNLLGGGFLLSLYGLYLLRFKRDLVIFLGGSTIIVVFFFGFYDVVDNEEMIFPALLLLSPPLACGAKQFFDEIVNVDRKRTFLYEGSKAGLLIIVTTSLLIANWSFANHHGDWDAYLRASRVLDQVEPDAIIVTQWTVATPLSYLQIVEHRRPDVEIIDRGMLALGIRDSMLRVGLDSDSSYIEATEARLLQIISEALKKRPVYLTEDDPSMRALFCYKPLTGILYKVVSATPDCDESLSTFKYKTALSIKG